MIFHRGRHCKKGTSYSFTPKELSYLMFGKNKCPKCGATAVKEKKFEFVTGAVAEANETGFRMFRDDANVKRYYYTFTCPKCRNVLTVGRGTEEV